jgi:hypothetical protein
MARKMTAPTIRDFCRRYVYVASLDRLYDRQTRAVITVRAATLRHAAEVGEGETVHHAMFKGSCAIDTVDGVTFWPGQPEIVEEDGGRKLNRWTPVHLSRGRAALGRSCGT